MQVSMCILMHSKLSFNYSRDFRRTLNTKIKIESKLEQAEQRRKNIQLTRRVTQNEKNFNFMQTVLKRAEEKYHENIETFKMIEQKSKERIQVNFKFEPKNAKKVL